MPGIMTLLYKIIMLLLSCVQLHSHSYITHDLLKPHQLHTVYLALVQLCLQWQCYSMSLSHIWTPSRICTMHNAPVHIYCKQQIHTFDLQMRTIACLAEICGEYDASIYYSFGQRFSQYRPSLQKWATLRCPRTFELCLEFVQCVPMDKRSK